MLGVRWVSMRRLRLSGLWAAVLVGLLLPSAASRAADTFVFGPETFQGANRPLVPIRTFTVTTGGDGYVLRVRNKGVTLALVALNQQIVLRPQDFGAVFPTRGTEDWRTLWERLQRELRTLAPGTPVPLIEKPVRLRSGRNDLVIAYTAPTGTAFTLEIVKPGATDTTPPVITTSLSAPANSNGWHRAPVTVTFTCSDAESGIATCPAAATVSDETASRVVAGTAVDRAGNQATANVTIRLDLTPPAVSASALPAANANDWHNTPVTVSFTATDALSGVAPGSVTSPVTLATDGTNLAASGQAIDLAGNVGTATRAGINLDQVPPTGTVAFAPPLNDITGWNNTALTAHVTCDDVGSGVTSCPADVVLAREGANQTTSGVIVDRADNARQITSPPFSLDLTPPTITVALIPPPPPTGIYTAPVTAHFTCADALSDIAICPADQTFSAAGTNLTATGTAIDRAFNQATATSEPFTIRVDVPTVTVTVTLSPPANANGWRNTPVTAHFVCTENGAPLATCPPDQVVGTEGANQTVSGSATGSAGRTVTATSEPFSIDLTPPTIAAAQTPAPSGSGWSNAASVTVHFTCADALSGPAACPPDEIVTAEGANQPAIGTVADLAGNTATTSTAVNLDRTPPVLALVPPSGGTTVFVPTLRLTGSVADTLSGVASATCNGIPAVLLNGNLSCEVALTPGANTVTATATDAAGNTSASTLDLQYTRVPLVTITAPAPASYLNLSPTTVSGTVDDPTATVAVNGIATVAANGAFSLALPLAEGPNTITATATSAAGAAGTASLQVTLDTTPPRVTISSPHDLFETTDETVSIAGIINDIVVGTVNAEQAQVTVNGTAAAVANRTFLATAVPLTVGPNVIRAVGRDRVGNAATTQITVVRRVPSAQAQIRLVSGNNQTAPIRNAVAAPLSVRLTDATGAPAANRPVIFKVTQNDGLVAGGGTPAPTVVATTDAQGQASVLWTLGGRAGAGGNAVEAYAVGFEGTAIFTATGTLGTAGQIVVDTNNNQIGAIGQPLPKPFIAVVVDEGHNRLGGVPVTFTVGQGGGTIDGQQAITITTDSDGRASATLTLGLQEGEANNLVSATFDGNQGFPAAFTASGRAPGDPARTTISGVVLDNSNAPVPGVTVRAVLTSVLHANPTATQTAPSARTDAQGRFVIQPAPIGSIKLLVDGSTATAPGTFPSLEYDTVTVAGQAHTVGQPIFILPLSTANQLCVTETTGGGTLTVPEAPGFSLTFSPGQVTFPGGSRAGCVTVSVVHPDKVPMMPGFGQQPRFIVTIQPSGAMFSPPAAITLPNVDGLAPRAVTEMYSFDHDISSFVAIGTGTVSDDGLVIRSNPGVGVLKAGWHCGGNPNSTGTAANCPICFFCPGSLSTCQPQGNGTPCGNGGTCQFGQGCVGGGGCPTGYVMNSSGQCCQGGTCVPPSCPPGQTFDPATGLCVNSGPCAPGFTLNSAGQCCLGSTCLPPSCPSGTVFDPLTGTCQTVLNTCTPQTAGQFCNAGGGISNPGRCDANGGCVGSGPGQCGMPSGCSACVTTAGQQQCTVCSNGQAPVNGQCPQFQLSIVSPSSSQQFAITETAQMPTVNAAVQVQGVSPDPTASTRFNWTVDVTFAPVTAACAHAPFRITSMPQIVTNVLGGQFDVPFQLSSVRGGNATLNVSANVNGVTTSDSRSFSIAGTNPMRSSVHAALPNDVLRQVACQESRQRQFIAAPNGGIGVCPYYSEDNLGGVGIFQITPYRSDDEVWNWRANVADGIGIFFNEKRPAARGYPAQVRNSPQWAALVNRFNAARQQQGLPPLQVTLPDFSSGNFDDNPLQLELDTIRGFNGFGGSDAFGFHLHEFRVRLDSAGDLVVDSSGNAAWERTPVPSRPQGFGDPDYVNNVLGNDPRCGN